MSFNDDGDPVRPEPKEASELIVKWLMVQKYDGQDILHAAVCCDYAGMCHLTKAIERILTDGTVYCHSCSLAGGADRAIYHEPPACK